MKIVILAAGVGKRLYPLTQNKPKCLIKIDGKSILEYQLENIKRCGFRSKDILIVTGYYSEKIEECVPKDVQILRNEHYNTANNIYSVWLLKDILDESFIIMNSDVLFHCHILQKLLRSSFPNALVVDKDKELAEEEMKVKLEKNVLREINKTMNSRESHGEYIGISKFAREGAQILFAKVDELIAQKRLEVWYESAFAEIVNALQIYAVSTDGLPWMEVDSFADLKTAKIIARKINVGV